jgi:MFS superfamily sulfate permease-like transporter
MTPQPTAARPGPWWADLFSSLVVFLVALPLCLGIAQACGLPPLAGIATGVVGGLVVGVLAGSPLQVSGPAAGLIVLVIQFLDTAEAAGTPRAEAVALLGVTIALAGGIQVAAGLLRLGQWFRAVSPAVVEGMLAGIGATIIAKQFHDMVDDEAPKRVAEGLLTIPLAAWKAVAPPAGAAANHQAAALVGGATILVLSTWKSLAPKALKLVPAAVVAVVLAVGLAEAGGLGVERVGVEGSLLASFRPMAWPGWGAVGSKLVLVGAVTFALIASAESLLCATAVDTMHAGPRTRYDRELVAQGVGNLLCGSIAALPMTGVIVRSSANVEAGARTRLSSVLHGLWLLLFVSLLPGLLSLIPGSALAAVLVYTGWKLVNLPGLARLWRESRTEALVFLATAATIVGADLLTGVVTGVVLSAAKLLYLFSHLRVTRRDDPAHDRVDLVLDGAGTFLRLPLLAEALEAVPRGRRLHVHLDGLRFVDHAVLHLLLTFQKQYEATGGRLVLDWDRLHAHFRGRARPEAAADVPPPGAQPAPPPHPVGT